MNRRSSKRLDAYRDGELSPRARARVEQRLARDPDSARHVEQTAALGDAVREAWRDGPPAPSAELLIAVLRPEMDRIDAEIAHSGGLGAWLEPLRRLLQPAPAGALAAACAVLLMLALPTDLNLPGSTSFAPAPLATPVAGTPVADTPLAAGEAATPIYDLAQGEQPLMILKGEDGSTVIWILEDGESFSGLVADGWA